MKSSRWMGVHRAPLERMTRSAAVGLVATLADLVLLSLLVRVGHVDPRVASVPALCLGIVIQFAGNKRFAFRDRSADWLRQALLFLAVEALSFTANLVLFDLGVRLVPLPLVALRLVTTNLVYFALALPLWARVFHPEES